MSNRHHHQQTSRSASGTGKRILWILTIGAVAAAAVTMFGTRSAAPRPGVTSAEPMSRMPAKKLQSHASDNGIIAGAHAAQRAIAEQNPPEGGSNPHVTIVVTKTSHMPVSAVVATAPPASATAPPVPPALSEGVGKPKSAIRFTRIRSEAPHTSREKAMADALVIARLKIIEELRKMDPPIESLPSLEMVRTQYLRQESVTEHPVTDAKLKEEWVAAKLDPNRMWVEIDVEVSEDQVRALRTESRLETVGLYAGIAFVVMLGIYGFLRLDSWTKGYLTVGIGVTIAALAAGAVALLVLSR